MCVCICALWCVLVCMCTVWCVCVYTCTVVCACVYVPYVVCVCVYVHCGMCVCCVSVFCCVYVIVWCVAAGWGVCMLAPSAHRLTILRFLLITSLSGDIFKLQLRQRKSCSRRWFLMPGSARRGEEEEGRKIGRGEGGH